MEPAKHTTCGLQYEPVVEIDRYQPFEKSLTWFARIKDPVVEVSQEIRTYAHKFSKFFKNIRIEYPSDPLRQQ
jgi:hypothetical protein